MSPGDWEGTSSACLEAWFLALPQDAYSKRFVSVACISRVAAISDQKFEVITHNRTFTFRAESDGASWEGRCAVRQGVMCKLGLEPEIT